jgi:CubicO group peptidase (beta-lactamase class C family)
MRTRHLLRCTSTALLSLIVLTACSDDAAPLTDTGARLDTRPSTDAAGDGSRADASATDAGGDPWQPVTALLDAEIKGGAIEGGWVALDVYRGADGKLVYSRAFGGGGAKDRTTLIAIASASKWVSSTVILSLVAEGKLGLDETTSKWLGWTGVEGGITLRQLLSFTSGLRDHACSLSALTTLDACVTKIQQAGAAKTPGAGFYYNGAHMAVAGRIAEKASGKSWSALFAERVVTPLALSSQTAYYTFPKNKLGQTNPLVAGGIVTSMKDYGAFLTALQGVGGTTPLLPAALQVEQHKEQWSAGTTIDSTPHVKPKMHYALGCWRECAKPDATGACDADLIVHSAGAFGTVPWIDLKYGYYAVLGAEADKATTGAGKYTIPLVTDRLRALIVKALGGG